MTTDTDRQIEQLYDWLHAWQDWALKELRQLGLYPDSLPDDGKARQHIADALEELNKLKRACLARTPDGTKLCYLCDDVLILLGQPPDEEEGKEPAHNCDEMGCGSMEHVIARKRLTRDQMDRLGAGETVGLTGPDPRKTPE